MPRYGQRSLYLSRCWLSEWCHTCIEARKVPDEGVLNRWQRSQPHRCFSMGLVKPLPDKYNQTNKTTFSTGLVKPLPDKVSLPPDFHKPFQMKELPASDGFSQFSAGMAVEATLIVATFNC